jgi:myosin regulatory light chain 12
MIEELLSARPGTHSRAGSAEGVGSGGGADRGINFTMFLTMMSERLFEFDPEAELVEAFGSFDENDAGVVRVDEMRKWLSEFGERMDAQEVSAMAV